MARKYRDPKFDQKSHTEEEKKNVGCGDTFCKPVLGMWGQVELPSQPPGGLGKLRRDPESEVKIKKRKKNLARWLSS